MLICIFPECHGHEDRLDAILHGQEHILRVLRTVITKEGSIMTDVDTLTADFDNYKTDVGAALDGLKATVQELKDELANAGTVVPPEVQAKLDALDADIAAADAVVKPVETPPVDETTV